MNFSKEFKFDPKHAQALFNAIAHGDHEHRMWLLRAIEAFNKDEPVIQEVSPPTSKEQAQ